MSIIYSTKGSPIRQIPVADAGTYPMRPSQAKPAPDAELLARVQPYLKESKYGDRSYRKEGHV